MMNQEIEPRVQCTRCGVSILVATSERCQGLCRPCFKQGLRTRLGLTPFGRAFDKTFIPFPRFKTDFGFDAWHTLDSYLAGPLYEIRQEGHCNYVFSGKHEAFQGIIHVSDFKDWCLTHLQEFRRKIIRFKPVTRQEQADKKRMWRKYREAKKVLEWASEVLKAQRP